jgi:hypothetical protein
MFSAAARSSRARNATTGWLIHLSRESRTRPNECRMRRKPFGRRRQRTPAPLIAPAPPIIRERHTGHARIRSHAARPDRLWESSSSLRRSRGTDWHWVSARVTAAPIDTGCLAMRRPAGYAVRRAQRSCSSIAAMPSRRFGAGRCTGSPHHSWKRRGKAARPCLLPSSPISDFEAARDGAARTLAPDRS